ncbi:MAG: polymer-forming cytoskeletal protein [Patescibacteria group bacterium]|nr:polymer-forming cytoskeletal protein [Patescibacteria group bacterium]MDD5566668.1 polymer-forming cytoskeletal protein [Patescibacteria group bacterium]
MGVDYLLTYTNMFTKDNKTDSETETIIGQSVRVEGNFTSQGNIVVEGGVAGTLKTSGNLRIGPNAKLKADVQAKSIFTSGEIRGNNIIASEKIEMTKTAKIFGNVQAPTISMEAGAILNGKVNMSAAPEVVDASLPLPEKKERKNNK